MPQEQTSADPFGLRDGYGSLYFIARCLECIWTIPLHINHGVRYPGFAGLLCFFLISIVSSLDDGGPVVVYETIWLGMLAVRRWNAFAAVRRGVYEHSEYAGFPALTLRLLPFLGTEIRARNVEPLFCLGVAWLVTHETHPLGKLLMAGAVGLAVTRLFDAQANWMQAVRMRDAAVLQRQHAARYRGESNEF